MKASTRIPFALLCSVPFVMVLSNSMLIPVLPAIQRALGLSLFRAGIIITAFSIPAGIAIPFGGYLSDRVGRKKVIVPALLIFGFGGLIAGLAPLFFGRSMQYMVILGARVIQGLGAGGLYQVAMALTGDIFQTQERSKALGMLEASNGVGKITSPIIGSAVALLAWFVPFFVYPLLAVPSAAGVWYLVPEPGTPGQKLAGKKKQQGQSSQQAQSREQSSAPRAGSKQKEGQDLRSYLLSAKKVFEKKGVSLLSSFLAGMVVLFLLFGVLSWYSDVLEKGYGIKGIVKGLVIALPVTGMAITSYVTGTVLQKKIARLSKVVVVAGMTIITVASVGMFFFTGIYLLSASIILLGVGNGLVLPSINTLITSSTESNLRGMVTSLYGSVRFFGAALGPPAFGAALASGRALMFLGSAGLAAVSALVAAFFVDQKALLPRKMRKSTGGKPVQKKANQQASGTGSGAQGKRSGRTRRRNKTRV